MVVYQFEFKQNTIVLILDVFFCKPHTKGLAKAVAAELSRCMRVGQVIGRIKQRLPLCSFEGHYEQPKPAGGTEFTLVCTEVEKSSLDWHRWREMGVPVENNPLDISER